MDIRVLGPVQVIRDGDPVPIGGPKQRAVVAILAANVGRSLSLDQIVRAAYGDDASSKAGRSVQTYVSALRRELGDVIVKDHTGYSLAVDPMEIDAVHFERQVQAAMPMVADDPATAAELLLDALALWRGEPYSNVNDAGGFTLAATRLDEMRLAALESRIDADLASGRDGELVGELETLIGEHPLRERFRAQHMLALYRSSRQADALRAYEDARTYLAEELGIDPSPELRQLVQRMLEQDPALLRLDAPQKPIPGNLPARIASFVGRSEETSQVANLVGQHRLVTLTGLGGIGKTTLALEVARRIAGAYPDGVWFVELAHVSDDESVPGEVARALGVAEHPIRPAVERVIEEFKAGTSLVVIDNCEHVIGAAANVVVALLRDCPAMHVLATSREPLSLPGEHAWRVHSLKTPPSQVGMANVAGFDAAKLFVARAKEADPRFELRDENAADVAAICRRLDGIPLALELAAARLGVLSSGKLLELLEDRLSAMSEAGRGRPERHQTLQAAMDWSHRLLSPEEQTVFRRLAVFRGGFTLEAAEAVAAGNDLREDDVLVHVNRLMKAGLLTRDAANPDRYGMLESVRDYAGGFLNQAGEERAIHYRHADYHSGLLEDEIEFDTPAFDLMLKRLAADDANFHAALAWAVDADENEIALTLARRLAPHWFFSANGEATLRWVPRVLEITDPAPSSERAELLHHLGSQLSFTNRRSEALAAVKELEAIAAQLDSPQTAAEAALNRSWYLTAADGDLHGARETLRQHHETTKHLEYAAKGLVLVCAADLSVMLGDFELAMAFAHDIEEGESSRRQQMTSSWTSSLSGKVAYYGGDMPRAKQGLLESLRIQTELGRTPNVSADLIPLAEIALAEGELEKASKWAHRIVAIGDQLIDNVDICDGHVLLARVALRKGLVNDAGRALVSALDAADQSPLLLAGVLAAAGDYARVVEDTATAVVLHSGAEALRTKTGRIHPLPHAQELEQVYAELRRALGAKAFDAAWELGASLSAEELVDRARLLVTGTVTTPR